MKRTPLYQEHLSMGAKMVEFAGWDMPVQYTSVLDEHRAVRERAGMFDVSHMGDLLVRGDDAEGQLRGLLTNDIKGLAVGKGLYSHLLNDRGDVIDDTITFHIVPGQYLMIPNASKEAEVASWIRNKAPKLEVLDLTERIACIALQGPKAEAVLQRLTDNDLTTLKRLRGDFIGLRVGESKEKDVPFLDSVSVPSVDGLPCYISRSGYTGEDGFEILSSNDSAVPIWRALLGSGLDIEIIPSGLGARDVLRLEMGYLLSGTDFDGSQTSLETGPDWVIKWDHEFIGKDALLKQRESGSWKRLVGLELQERGIPRHGYPIMDHGSEIGNVTSGTLSPVLNKGIALGYLDTDHHAAGTEVDIAIRDMRARAKVTVPPFIKRKR